jgi:large subunit ribosomal protein L22
MLVLKIKVKNSRLWEVVKNNMATVKEEKKELAFAKLTNCPTSPRKMRLVADQVRGVEVEKALQILKFNPKEASSSLEKLLLSALQTGKLKTKMLILKMLDYL